jgi:hypothetical protein
MRNAFAGLPAKAFLVNRQRRSRLDIGFKIEGEASAHLFPLLLVLNFLLSAIGTPIGSGLTSELIAAVSANVHCDFLHSLQSFTSDFALEYTHFLNRIKGKIVPGIIFAVS